MPALHILAISQSFQVGLEWYKVHIIRPHVEQIFAKFLKIGPVIAIFVRLTKIQKRVTAIF